MLIRGIGVVLVLLATCWPGRASDVLFRKDSIFLFGGVYSAGNMGQTLNPFYHHEHDFIFGGAYRRNIVLGRILVLSAEAGLAGRFGDRSSAEFWAGPNLRLRGIPIGNFAMIAPGFTVGLSAVTRANEIEHRREIEHGGNATTLFYFGPELAFRLRNLPNAEIVYRLHHRSGFYNALGKMQEGSNAHVLGLRWRL